MTGKIYTLEELRQEPEETTNWVQFKHPGQSRPVYGNRWNELLKTLDSMIGSSTYLELDDTPATFSPNTFVRNNAGGTGLEHVSGASINISEFNNDSGYITSSTNLGNTNLTLSGPRTLTMGTNNMTFFSTGDANLLQFDNTNDRIGIGVASPLQKLHLNGGFRVDASVVNQLFVSSATSFVGIGTSSQSGAIGEILRVAGAVRFDNVVVIPGTQGITMGSTSLVSKQILMNNDYSINMTSTVIKNTGGSNNIQTFQSDNGHHFQNVAGTSTIAKFADGGTNYSVFGLNASTTSGTILKIVGEGTGTSKGLGVYNSAGSENLSIQDNGTFKLSGFSSDQFFVDGTKEFVGVGILTQLAGEIFRVQGDIHCDSRISIGSTGAIPTNGLNLNDAGMGISIAGGTVLDNLAGVTRITGGTTGSILMKTNFDNPMLLLDSNIAEFESDPSNAIDTLRSEVVKIISHHWDGADQEKEYVITHNVTNAGTGQSEVNHTIGATEVARFDESTTAADTRFMIYDVDNATLERVTVGAADSGGTGFKVLRIPN